MSDTVTVRRLFTELDMASAFLNGYARGWVRTAPATDREEIARLFLAWMDKKFPEGWEVEQIMGRLLEEGKVE
jgi:hypothetical protein